MRQIEASLETLDRGAVVAAFNAALERVLEDIADPNTQADKKRVITLKVELLTDERRRELTVDHSITFKLPGFRPGCCTVCLLHTKSGLKAVEVDPEQMTLEDAIEAADSEASNVAHMKGKPS